VQESKDTEDYRLLVR